MALKVTKAGRPSGCKGLPSTDEWGGLQMWAGNQRLSLVLVSL